MILSIIIIDDDDFDDEEDNGVDKSIPTDAISSRYSIDPLSSPNATTGIPKAIASTLDIQRVSVSTVGFKKISNFDKCKGNYLCRLYFFGGRKPPVKVISCVEFVVNTE